MIRHWPRALFAATLGVTMALPALAEPARLENSLTAGGLNIAPRYLDKVGDVDLNLLGGLLNYPASQASLVGGQFSLQARIHDKVQLLANMGPLAEIGLRGPITELSGLKLGWDAHYRSDLYFLIDQGPGRTAPMFGLAPYPGSSAHGLEAKLNAMYARKGFTLFASPLAAVMSNRTMAGVEAGIDWAWDRLGLGYAVSYRANVVNPAQSVEAVAGNEVQHSVGARYGLGDRLYAQANYFFQPSDTYAIANQGLLAGIGMRLFGATAKAPVAMPAPVAAATPAPIPTPAPVATPVTQRVILEGRFVHSLSEGGNPGTPLTARLKYRKPGTKGFEKVEATTQTDAQGNFRFEDLPLGEYQVFFKDEGRLGNVVDVAVGDAVKVKPGITRSEIDIAWDEQSFKAQLAGKTQTIDWADKLGVEDAVYQGLLRGTTGSQQLEFLNFPEKVGPQSEGSFTLSDAIKAEKVYYVIKYWKKDGLFNAETFYGQSKPIELKLP
ncbi:carboxypeptidase regulatory-like domain-containing protein [bacterium]|nr:carboxypeptidase regulatory-like domain-containing protein [bacterium]